MAKREPIRVLVVDDAATCRAMLADAVWRDARCRLVGEAESVAAGLRLAGRERPDVLILDFCLPDRSGFDAIPDFRRASPGVRVVLCSDKVGPISVAGAAQLGADAYVEKAHGSAAVLEAAVATCASNGQATTALTGPLRWIGESEASRRVRAQLALAVARQPRVLLITGERGTGKGFAARLYHSMGSRAHKEPIKVNVARVAEHLIESEFRGHVAGAFTGATRRVGHIEAASGGTLILDEIGEMPLVQQAVFLDVIEDRTVTPVGSSTPHRVDGQFIALTNKELLAAVEAGTFRGDLYDRLTQFCIELPPLRERREDIPELAAFKLAEIADRTERHPAQSLTPEAFALLSEGPWPGNVRKLFDAVELASTLAGSGLLIDIDHVRAAIPATGASARRLQDAAPMAGAQAAGMFPPRWPPRWLRKGAQDRQARLRAVSMALDHARRGWGQGGTETQRVASLLGYTERHTRELLRELDAVRDGAEPLATPP